MRSRLVSKPQLARVDAKRSMRRRKNQATAGKMRAHQSDQRALRRCVEGAGGLIQEPDRALDRKQASDRQAPPLAGGEMVGSQAESPVRRISSGSIEAVDPHDRLLAFAKFGELPRTIWGAPLYALRVHRRRRTLQRELDDARRRRSPDVALYEAALRTADMPTVHVGISVAVAIAVLAVPLVIGIVQVVLGELASR